MAQFLRPNNDDTIGAWTDEASGTTDIYTGIDEVTAEDTELVRSENDPSSSAYIGGLSSGDDPLSSIDHIVRYRYLKGQSGGGSPGVIDLIVELRQGVTVIASQTHNGITTTVTAGTFTLTGGEADNITNYADLNFRFVADKSSGARTSWAEDTWFEFQIPDAASGDISGTINASSAVTANLVGKTALSGTVSANSLVTTNLIGRGLLSGEINANSVVTANLVATGQIKGTISANSVVTANLIGTGIVKGTINCSSSVSCNLVNQPTIAEISGTVNASSSVTANLVGKGRVFGVINALSTVTANLLGKGVLKGVINTLSTVTANLIGRTFLSGTISGSSSVTAVLKGTGVVKGSINANSNVTCKLISAGAIFSPISGTINCGSTVTCRMISAGDDLEVLKFNSYLTIEISKDDIYTIEVKEQSKIEK